MHLAIAIFYADNDQDAFETDLVDPQALATFARHRTSTRVGMPDRMPDTVLLVLDNAGAPTVRTLVANVDYFDNCGDSNDLINTIHTWIDGMDDDAAILQAFEAITGAKGSVLSPGCFGWSIP